MGDSDWKQSAINRSDFRRSKLDPEVPKKRKKNKQKNKYKLVIKDFSFGSWMKDDPKDYIIGRYTNKIRAEQAKKNQKHDLFWSKYKMIIEEI